MMDVAQPAGQMHAGSAPEISEGEFYRDVIRVLQSAGVPFLVGGGFAFFQHTGLSRATKDLDLFILPEDFSRVLDMCAAAGYRTKVRFTHWLGKVFQDGQVIDIILAQGTASAQWMQTGSRMRFLGRCSTYPSNSAHLRR